MNRNSTIDRSGAGDGIRPCPEPEKLACFVDGRLTAAEAAEVEAHLAGCEDCYFVFAGAAGHQRSERNAGLRTARTPGWRAGWSKAGLIGLLSAAAAIAIAVLFLPRNVERNERELQQALNELDAAAGPWRASEARLTSVPGYRPVRAVMRSAEPLVDPALRLTDAALRLTDATRQVEEAASRVQDTEKSRRALGTLYLTVGNAGRAVSTLSPLEESNDARVLSDLAAAYLTRRADGDESRAMRLLERAVGLDPGLAGAWFNLGLAAKAAGATDRARQAWIRSAALDGESGWGDEARLQLEKLKQ
jgi:tetratricopeptide (TPR) repeat protein